MTVITDAHGQRCETAGCLRWRYALSWSAPSLFFHRTAGDIYSIFYVIIFCMVMAVMMVAWLDHSLFLLFSPYFEFYFVINLFACLCCCFFVVVCLVYFVVFVV